MSRLDLTDMEREQQAAIRANARRERRRAQQHEHPTLPVLFRVYRRELTAYFPTDEWNERGTIPCYAHIGQHGAASRIWLSKGRPATEAESRDLLRELRGIYESGDDEHIALKVYRRAPGRGRR